MSEGKKGNGAPGGILPGLPGGPDPDMAVPEGLKQRIRIYMDAAQKKAENLSISMQLATGKSDSYHSLSLVLFREVALLRCDLDDLLDRVEQIVENQEAIANIASSVEDG